MNGKTNAKFTKSVIPDFVLHIGDKLVVNDDEEDFALARGDCPCCHTKDALFGPSQEQLAVSAQKSWNKGEPFNHYYMCERCLVIILMAEDRPTEVIGIKSGHSDWFFQTLWFFCFYGDTLTRLDDDPIMHVSPWMEDPNMHFILPEFEGTDGEVNLEWCTNDKFAYP